MGPPHAHIADPFHRIDDAENETTGIDGRFAFVRNAMRVELPVTFTLATKKEPIGRILDLQPGAILHFDTPCDTLLAVSVGQKQVAVGRAVRVGERLGVRIERVIDSTCDAQ